MMDKLLITICLAVLAYAFVIKLHLVNGMPVYVFGLFHSWRNLVKKIVNMSTFTAKEMNVRANFAIITHAMIVNGDHLGSVMLSKKSQRVIDSGSTQCPYFLANALIDILYGWVSVMGKQVIHNSQTLHG